MNTPIRNPGLFGQRSFLQMTPRSGLFGQRSLRLMTATLVLAGAGAMAQSALAQPHGGSGGRGGFDHGGPAIGMLQPQMLGRALDAANATPEQRAQIKQILQTARTETRPQHETSRQLRQQAATLFAQPTVDARAAEALRVQMLAQHDLVSKRMLRAMLDVSAVLTAEQRKTLGDKLAQRHAGGERHRAEGAAAEGSKR